MHIKYLSLFCLISFTHIHTMNIFKNIVTSNVFLNPLSFGTTVALKGPRLENNSKLNHLEQAKQYVKHPDTLKIATSSFYSLLIATMACKHPKIMRFCKTSPRLFTASSIIGFAAFKTTEFSIDQIRKSFS